VGTDTTPGIAILTRSVFHVPDSLGDQVRAAGRTRAQLPERRHGADAIRGQSRRRHRGDPAGAGSLLGSGRGDSEESRWRSSPGGKGFTPPSITRGRTTRAWL